ncbi:MAG TPA: hypothetical protein GXX29_07470 [Firmicutes bacterium]|nr:hypothetical protein [Bacillota bacterium]
MRYRKTATAGKPTSKPMWKPAFAPLLKYPRLAFRSAGLCLSREMQYRLHFWGNTFAGVLWTGMYLVFIEVILSHTGSIAGWDRPAMYVLYGTYMILEAVAGMIIMPNMIKLTEYVRTGELDLLLTKPIDTQFYLSVRHWEFAGTGRALIGLTAVAYGLKHTLASGGGGSVLPSPALHPATLASPAILSWLSYLVSLVAAFLLLYALWLLSVLIIFWVIKAEGLGYLFVPIMQIARYPISAYPPLLQAAFRTVLPLAFVAAAPSSALLGRATPAGALVSLVVAGLFLLISRAGWLFALRHYSSASS